MLQLEFRWAAARRRRLSTTPCANVGVECIHQVDSKRLYWSIQDRLEVAAPEVRVPRVWFDDVWCDRTREDA
jgi:hypothetical protein